MALDFIGNYSRILLPSASLTKFLVTGEIDEYLYFILLHFISNIFYVFYRNFVREADGSKFLKNSDQN